MLGAGHIMGVIGIIGTTLAIALRQASPVAEGAISFEEVYEAHFAFAWRSLRALGVPPASIDDAAQDVFVIVHRKLSRLQSREQGRSCSAR